MPLTWLLKMKTYEQILTDLQLANFLLKTINTQLEEILLEASVIEAIKTFGYERFAQSLLEHK